MLLAKFKEYTIIGGMPKAVDTYVSTKDFKLVEEKHNEIINWYRRDIIKYSDIKDRLIISEMYENLASEINQQNRKFVKSHLVNVNNFRNLDLEDRFLWMYNAGIAIPVYNAHNPIYPLKASKDRKNSNCQ